ncbi:MAG: efflux RND transporter periplasmic adaptor subunit [Proteobacteria bacterium]|nr:efflux RND transporter periplasmic adaptor subunit [Pseudomonadota bacterium]MBU1057143.1 efflux RND transporter periplasmic adaptor subunit [Pseudomonadota bacterium]
MSQPLPRLRDDLRITPIADGEENTYIIEDPLSNTYFKIGLREYRFLCSLSRGEALLFSSEEEEGEATGDEVTREEALAILQWLATKQLLQNQTLETMQALDAAAQQASQKSLLARLNLITFRLSLFNPDPLLSRFMPWLSWLAGPYFLALWLLFAISAFGVLLVNWSRFVHQGVGFFSASNLMILSLIWLGLKLLHELSHALACRRHGGRVYDMGVLFILFIPLTYVNASSSWSFPSRWQRIHVALAGMYMELFVAWLAILYWGTHFGTPAGMIAHNTALVAGVSSLLFNANPLMRFDGYYVFSDLVSVPNLYFRGLDSVRKAGKKWWLGISEQEENEGHSLFVKLYGIAVYCWRILVLCSLAYLASRLFSGWGMLLTLVAAFSWIYNPLAAFRAKIPTYRQENPRFLSHLLTRVSLVALIGGFALFGINWQKNITIPAVVLFEEQFSIRAGASGFVEKIFVRQGEQVQAGQELVLLGNEELASSGRGLALELAILEVQRRTANVQGRYAELQMLEERKAILVEQKRNVDSDEESLLLRAPGSGTVVGKGLESRIGTWINKGEELFLVVNPSHKHLVASVDQDDISSFRGREGEDVQVDMSEAGQGIFVGRIEKVAPSASTNLVHFSFAAPFGGPFDVRATTGDGKESGYQLFSPRFPIDIGIPESIRPGLRDGQQAVVRAKGVSRSPATLLWQGAKSWFLGRQNQKG